VDLQTKSGLADNHFGPVVYFVQGGETGPIKIGQTDNIDMRLRAMQATSPVKLNLRGIIVDPRKKKREAKLHERFAATRLHGEWFEPTRQLLAYIKRYAEPYRLPERAAKAPRDCEHLATSPTTAKAEVRPLREVHEIKKQCTRAEAMAAMARCRESVTAGHGWTSMPKGWIRFRPPTAAEAA
jgi:hypothetical protein